MSRPTGCRMGTVDKGAGWATATRASIGSSAIAAIAVSPAARATRRRRFQYSLQIFIEGTLLCQRMSNGSEQPERARARAFLGPRSNVQSCCGVAIALDGAPSTAGGVFRLNRWWFASVAWQTDQSLTDGLRR